MLGLFLGFLFSILMLPRLIPYLNSIFLDFPNNRSSHVLPVPRAGGIAFVFAPLIASFLSIFLLDISSPASIWIPIISTPLAIVGLIDDRYSLPVRIRLIFQLLISFGLVSISPLFPSFLIYPVLIFISSSVINFTNFMDGLDGLVAGCMSVALAAVSFSLSLPLPYWVLVGSLLGFVYFNWSPAKVFMGDVGSTFLGAVYFGLILQSSSWLQTLSFLLILTPLLGDSLFCLLRRLFSGQRVFQAHCLHLFQRLQQAGWPHARVSSFYIAGTVLLSIAMLLGGLFWVLMLALVELLVGVWLDQRFAVPFKLASLS